MTDLSNRMQLILKWSGDGVTPMSMRAFARKAGLKSESHIQAIIRDQEKRHVPLDHELGRD